MGQSVDGGNIEVSVTSEAVAERLREDFADLTVRVNMDLVTQKFNPRDPVSVEMAIAQAERSIDYHLTSFPENTELQSLAPEIKRRFRAGLEAQSYPR